MVESQSRDGRLGGLDHDPPAVDEVATLDVQHTGVREPHLNHGWLENCAGCQTEKGCANRVDGLRLGDRVLQLIGSDDADHAARSSR